MGCELNVETVKRYVNYNPETGVFTSALTGRPVGSMTDKGILLISIGRGKYTATRIAWIYMTGKRPKATQYVIQRNRIHRDLRWDNLELSSRSRRLSGMEQPHRKHSKYPGVYRSSKQGHPRPWYTRVTYNGEVIHLGTYDDEEEAYNVRQRGLALVNAEDYSGLRDLQQERSNKSQKKTRR